MRCQEYIELQACYDRFSERRQEVKQQNAERRSRPLAGREQARARLAALIKDHRQDCIRCNPLKNHLLARLTPQKA